MTNQPKKCPECGSKMRYVPEVEWQGDESDMVLECPNADWHGTGKVGAKKKEPTCN